MTKSTFLEFGITKAEDVLAMFSHILIRLTTPPVPAVLLLLAGFVALNVTTPCSAELLWVLEILRLIFPPQRQVQKTK